MLLGLASSYSWYDIFVFAVSQDGPGGRQYESDWNPNIVLTAEDSKANSDLLLLIPYLCSNQ